MIYSGSMSVSFVSSGTHQGGIVAVNMRSTLSCLTRERNLLKPLPLRLSTLSSGMINSGIR